MKVKDIIARALTFAGREDIAARLFEEEIPAGECGDAVKTAVLCFNAVEDELARFYLPLKRKQKFVSGGEVGFSEFFRRPVKIISVKNFAGKCDFEVGQGKLLTCAGEITVEYSYAPEPKSLDGDSEYSETQAGLSLMAAGTASEFCLISGDAGAAEIWENRYRREIDLVRGKRCGGVKIPPRRWV